MTLFGMRKFANAFVPEAPLSGCVQGSTRASLERFRQRQEGLWVGGVVAANVLLSFVPNALNRALHIGLEPVGIPAQTIRSVRREFGRLSGIVVVEHAGGEFRFRCFGARGVARVLAMDLLLLLPITTFALVNVVATRAVLIVSGLSASQRALQRAFTWLVPIFSSAVFPSNAKTDPEL